MFDNWSCKWRALEQVKNSALSEITDRRAKITELQEEYLKIEVEVAEKGKAIAAITKEKENQMSSEFKVLSEKVDNLSKELVKVGSAVSNQKDSLEVEKATVAKVTSISSAIIMEWHGIYRYRSSVALSEM